MASSPGAGGTPAQASSSVVPGAAVATRAAATAELGWPPPVLDLHTDVPWQVKYRDRSVDLREGHITPATLRQGNYRGVVFVLYLPHGKGDDKPSPEATEQLADTVAKIVARHELLRRAPAPAATPWPDGSGKVDVLLAIEGANAFAADPAAIDRFIAEGVRYVGLLHSQDNALGTSATGRGRGGLTAKGRELAQRIYERGALVDASHMSDASFRDLVPIAKAAGAPLLASHSNARAVCDHPRNLTDEQLEAIAASGGVAGLNLHRSFVRRGKAKLEHAVAHVEHMVKVAGIDHVAIGTDFDGGTPVGALADAAHLPELAEALTGRGMSREDVHRIFWRNARRVLDWTGPEKH
jgi:membrane dipeptidase